MPGGRDPFSDFARGAKRGWQWGWSGEGDNAFGTAIAILFLPFALVWLLCLWIASLFRDEAREELEEARRLFGEIERLHEATPYAAEDALDDFAVEIVSEVCRRAGFTPSEMFAVAMYRVVRDLLEEDNIIFGLPHFVATAPLSLDEGVTLRAAIKRKRLFLQDHKRFVGIARKRLISILEQVIEQLPPAAYIDADEEEDERQPSLSIVVSLIDLCDEPAAAVERVLVVPFEHDLIESRMFVQLRTRLERNVCAASGIPWEKRESTSKPLVLPTNSNIRAAREIATTYLAGTSFHALFELPLPFHVPFPVRFEHTLVVGGTGHGKTQLLQLLIHHDIEETKKDRRSIVVIDSQGDLIRTISHLAKFDPEAPESLAERLLIVDPNDVEYPVCLNMFDWNRERLSGFSPVDREKVLNGTIELYEYLFGALLGAELTQKQGVVFRYLARLMMEIPGATVHTLRQLMENGEPFRPYMEKLPGTARSFFETRFFDRSFNETKKQILTRLWGVLSNSTLERMFSSPKSKVDLFEATNSGKVILINTAKELLQQEGCAIFGRFFIALIAQAAMQRAALPAHERTPTFVYIDEAQDYFDENIGQLLSQARKYRLGMVLAHQNLDQLPAGLRASVMANASTKFAGGLSAKDASALSAEMRCDSEFLGRMRRRKQETTFACFVRNFTPHAVEVTIPLGHVESLPTLAEDAYAALIEANRARYCVTVAEIEALSRTTSEASMVASATPAQTVRRKETPPWVETPSPAPPRPPATYPDATDTTREPASAPSARSRPRAPPDPAPLGRGGARHKYVQQVIKQAAEERNIRATIEEPLPEGGRVDVALSLGDKRIACEVSVTTAREQELGNVEKCLAAGYSEVVLIASSERHRTNLRKFITPHLDESACDLVRFLMVEEVIDYLDEVAASPEASEVTVRGYRVRVTRKTVSEEDAKMRRQAVAQVIARSLKKQ